MYRQIAFTDLDGTLIFSAAKKRPGDIVCEFKDGAEISCVTPEQAALLPGLSCIVPVTTRSMEQYRRIRFPKGFRPVYALTDNGGMLLINGEPDKEWAEQSLCFTEECGEELSLCRGIMERDKHRSFEIRMVDGLFLFTKSDSPERSLALVKEAAGEKVRCFSTGAKLYALPAKLCKGQAALRLAKRLSPGGLIISAGDSLMDIPLLNIADIAVFPEDLPGEMITAPERLTAARERFPEFVTRRLYDFISKGTKK